MTTTINAATLRDRLDRKLADLLATAGELRAIMAEATPCPHCRDGKVWTDTRWIPCSTCHGTGILAHSMSDLDIAVRSNPRTQCPKCCGRGDVTTFRTPAHPTGRRTCPDCDGTGYATRCPSCGGTTGSYDGRGQWYDCTVCSASGYATGGSR